MLRTIAASALLATSFSANAGVRYNWENLTSNPLFGAAFGSFEINEAYWAPGATVSLVGVGWPVLYFGIDSFQFDSLDITYHAINLGVGPCGIRCVDPDTVIVTEGTWSFNMTLGNYLTGSIVANDTQSDTRMSSLGSVWTIERIASDWAANGCDISQNACGGGTGRWVLDQTTVPIASPVPEPETWAMMILGLAFVGTAVKRRRDQHGSCDDRSRQRR